MTTHSSVSEIGLRWSNDPRWSGVERPYGPADVARLRGSVPIEHTLAHLGADRLWRLVHTEPYVAALGALTGHLAIPQVQGGPLNAFELMKAMIEAGASAVHFEDQLASAKKCGHMGGKVLVPVQEFIQKLIAARLAADIMNVPTILVARTDANSANLITSDIDPRDGE